MWQQCFWSNFCKGIRCFSSTPKLLSTSTKVGTWSRDLESGRNVVVVVVMFRLNETTNLRKVFCVQTTFFNIGPFRASFSFIFVFSVQLLYSFDSKLNFLMTGFEPRISGVGNDRSTNCATTTCSRVLTFLYRMTLTITPCRAKLCIIYWNSQTWIK